MMTHILLNLPAEYQTILEILEDKLDDKDNPLTIERIRDKISVKFDRRNEKSGPRTSRKYKNPITSNPNTRVPAQLVGNTGTR